MSFFSFFRPSLPAITYAITVCNEHDELELLLSSLIGRIAARDEIVVLQDVTVEDQGVTNVIKRYESNLLHVTAKLEGDFAKFKNNLLKYAKGDYLFQIDADELPSDYLLTNLAKFLRKNKKVDCYAVSRINVVDNISADHLTRWNWSQNKDGYINYPDFQMRLFKLKGSSEIYWVNKVHERLTGYNRLMDLPIDDYRFSLLHRKDIAKQEKQNDFYETIG
ncbi:glycosyltransferase [Sphingobacterium oryzagri]|uniref:Glycosyltransferase n=1 Tax=Sphingobacterium oryzagri TaxID=3025669 RepID=A0ABY7WIS2_9SPHI|nr:glycosyltransferase [Sphingobacterium sp. KACC 22765]WDF69514.1 glycosyltransferase [Sphingobacterium sp. KACC 22765]